MVADFLSVPAPVKVALDIVLLDPERSKIPSATLYVPVKLFIEPAKLKNIRSRFSYCTATSYGTAQ